MFNPAYLLNGPFGATVFNFFPAPKNPQPKFSPEIKEKTLEMMENFTSHFQKQDAQTYHQKIQMFLDEILKQSQQMKKTTQGIQDLLTFLKSESSSTVKGLKLQSYVKEASYGDQLLAIINEVLKKVLTDNGLVSSKVNFDCF